ncbi:unnamed protein product [Schistosoma mattheei]|uniref:Uncharacterized protein n=1 Tax=Schistosoma mattheei TaxID=31246 RepID=A0A183P2Q7_9TREM|nr:unnamed protein product [Schistosoma mattheei]
MHKSRSRTSGVYRVEHLVGKRIRGSRVEYLVKWKNWSDDEKRKKAQQELNSHERSISSESQRSSSLNSPDNKHYDYHHDNISKSKENVSMITSPERVLCSRGTIECESPILSKASSVYTDPILSTFLNTATTSTKVICNDDSDNVMKNIPTSSCSPNLSIDPMTSNSSTRTTPNSISSPINIESNNNNNDLCFDRRFPHSRISGRQTQQTTNIAHTENSQPIRLTIPRDRILPCPPVGVSSNSSCNSQNSSQLTSSSIEDSDHSSFLELSTALKHDDSISTATTTTTHFIAPVELPRRSSTTLSPHTFNPTGGMRLPEIQIENSPQSFYTDTIGTLNTCKSPKWTKQTPCINTSNIMQLPKLFISSTTISSSSSTPFDLIISTKKRHRQFRSESCLSSPGNEEYECTKKRKHSQKKDKHYNVNVSKIRRRSGSSTSLTSSLSTDSFSPTISNNTSPNEDFPRLAPLRIHLPRSLTTQLSGPDISTKHSNDMIIGQNHMLLHNTTNQIHSNYRKQIHLVPEMCITDITVDGLTISIKECSGPGNFFGIPTSQLVQHNCYKNEYITNSDDDDDDFTTVTTVIDSCKIPSTTVTTTNSTSTITTPYTITAMTSPIPLATRTIKPLCLNLKEQNLSSVITKLDTSIDDNLIINNNNNNNSISDLTTKSVDNVNLCDIKQGNVVSNDNDNILQKYVKKNSLSQYADENVAPDQQQNCINYTVNQSNLDMSDLSLHSISPISNPSPLLTSSSPDTTCSVAVTSLPSSSPEINNLQLSTIYEETETSSTTISSVVSLENEHKIKNETIIESCSTPNPTVIKSENELTINPSTSPIIVNNTPVPSSLSAPSSSTPEIVLASHSQSSSSSFMLAATEAIMKSSLNSPSSPGLLLPPRRSSTPIEHSPPYIPQLSFVNSCKKSNLNETLCEPKSPPQLHETTTLHTNQTNDSNLCKVNNPITSINNDINTMTTCISVCKSLPTLAINTTTTTYNNNNTNNNSSPRKSLNLKPPITTTTITANSSTRNRPMATIFGQVRNRGTTSIKYSTNTGVNQLTSTTINNTGFVNTVEYSPSRKTSVKSKYSSTTITNNWNNYTCDTLNSPKPIGMINASQMNNNRKKINDLDNIYTFPGESPTYTIPTGSSTINNTCHLDTASSSSPRSITSIDSKHTNSCVRSKSTIKQNHYLQRNQDVKRSNPDSSALAAAVCLQQLQMQMMCCTTNPTAMAVALNALNGFSSNSFIPNMNFPSIHMNPDTSHQNNDNDNSTVTATTTTTSTTNANSSECSNHSAELSMFTQLTDYIDGFSLGNMLNPPLSNLTSGCPDLLNLNGIHLSPCLNTNSLIKTTTKTTTTGTVNDMLDNSDLPIDLSAKR